MANREGMIAEFEALGETAVRDWVISTNPLGADPIRLQRAKAWLDYRVLQRQERTQRSAKHAAWASALAAAAAAIAAFIAAYLSYVQR